MLTSLYGRCIGVAALVCVVLLFFFPLAQGNFQSTHGPVTALRSKRNLLAVFLSIACAALLLLAVLAPRVLFAGYNRLRGSVPYSGSAGLPAGASVLRC